MCLMKQALLCTHKVLPVNVIGLRTQNQSCYDVYCLFGDGNLKRIALSHPLGQLLGTITL